MPMGRWVAFAESGHRGSGALAEHGVHGAAHLGPSVHRFNPHPADWRERI
jgi:hypothetical protein